MNTTRYTWTGIHTGSLPSHCERIAKYWATLNCFYPYASGKAAAQKFKSVRAFKQGLRDRGLPEPQIDQAYIDTLEISRLLINARQSHSD